MGQVQRRPAPPADDLLCALAVPAAIYATSPVAGAATAAVLAAVAAAVCLADFRCGSPLSVAGAALAVAAAGWAPGQGAGQVARLALLAACQLLVAGSLLGGSRGSATGGEALLLGQAAALLCAVSAAQLPDLLLFGSPLLVGERAGVIHLLQTAFCLLLALLLLLTHLPAAREAVWLHILLALLAAAVVVVSSVIINTNCLVWIADFAVASALRVRLLTCWAALLAGAVLLAAVLSSRSRLSCSRAELRKLFHLLVCVVFVPGLLYDPLLLLAASAGLTFLFAIVEVARACRLQPWARAIQAAFAPFLDDKDGGLLVLSDIHLLVACSGALWYHADTVTAAGRLQDPALFAGVITVGVGDTAAAVVGSRLGRHRWPGSHRTVEGSVAAVAAQLGFCLLLDRCQLLTISWQAWRALCVAVGVTTLAEAFTRQADNLLLPPLFVAAFRMADTLRW